MNFITFKMLMPTTETTLSAATGETRPNTWVDYVLMVAVGLNVLAAIVAPLVNYFFLM